MKRIRWVWVMVAWTIFLWVSRLRNVLSNDDLSAGGRGVRIAIVAIFVALALGAGYGLWRGRLKLVWTLIVWTVGYWLVRGIGILIDDYSAGFKVVHTVLMVISIGLAAMSWRQQKADPTSAPTFELSR